MPLSVMTPLAVVGPPVPKSSIPLEVTLGPPVAKSNIARVARTVSKVGFPVTKATGHASEPKHQARWPSESEPPAPSAADSQVRGQEERWAAPPAGMCKAAAKNAAPLLRFLNRIRNPDGFPVEGLWFEQDPAPPPPPAAGAEVVAAGLAAAGRNFEDESPMLVVNLAPDDGPSQLDGHASDAKSSPHPQAHAIRGNLQPVESGMVNSPGLWKFLHEQELQNGCFVFHIASNYWGPDRPSSGKGKLKKWLKTLSFLEVYTDASGELCVRLASSSVACRTAHCSSSVTELGSLAQDCAASAGQSQQPQKTPGHAAGASDTQQPQSTPGQRKRKRPETLRGTVVASPLGTGHPSSSN